MTESTPKPGPINGTNYGGNLPPVEPSPWRQRLVVQRAGIRLSVGTLGLIILAFLVLSVILFPYLLVLGPSKADMIGLTAVQRITANNDLAQTRNAVRTTLVQAIGGALLIVSGGIAWAQVQTARRGQLTDRLTKSVDQLGNEKREVRLGGIYALRQVADSPQYTRAVAEVLLAYLKTASLNSGKQDNGKPTQDSRSVPQVQRQKKSSNNVSLTDSSSANWADLQAVLRILVTDKLWLRSEAGRLDLSSISVPFAPLEGADLNGSIMADASLTNAHLRGAHLAEANMEDIDLEHADLRGADLTGAALSRSNLSWALVSLSSTPVGLEPAKLVNVQASHANFSDADLTGSDLSGGAFDHANLSRAILNSAKLRGAKFWTSTLAGANFNNADLSGADFTGANLSGVDFSGVNLSGAILRIVVLDGVIVDQETQLDSIDADDSARAQLALPLAHETDGDSG